MPITANDKLLVHLNLPAPAGWLEKVAERYPQLTVLWKIAKFDPSIPDVENVDVLDDEILEGVTMICVFPPFSAEKLPNVRYLQLVSAGSDRWVNHPYYLDPKVQFCNASGAYSYVRSSTPLDVFSDELI